jgi:hypothetical protein
MAGPEFVRRLIAKEVTGEDVRAKVADFTASTVPARSDGQIDRAAQRLGLIAAAGELATALELVPWHLGEAREAAAWALTQWIEGRGGPEPAEVRQAIEQVRLFIEQHGESRFDTLDDPDARPVNNRAGWRKGSGLHREWMVPPEVWKTEICNGLDPTMDARTLTERDMFQRVGDGFQPVRKIDGANKRVYVVTAKIFGAAMKADLAAKLGNAMRGVVPPKTGVAGVVGVAGMSATCSKPLKLQRLRQLRVKNDELANDVIWGVVVDVAGVADPDQVELEERKGMAMAACVPERYLDAWARLQCQRPAQIAEAVWRQAIDDAGRFLDQMGKHGG